MPVQVTIQTKNKVQDILSALFMEYGTNGIEETENNFIAYFSTEDEANKVITQLSQDFEFTAKIDEFKEKNWNAVWESNYQPIVLDNYCQIIASFHERKEGIKHTIVINPKMAFGTGHHETTLMMVKAIREINCENKHVLDLGCGTGILGILAKLEGANSVLAVDIEEHVKELVEENVQLNQVEDIKALHGTIDDVHEQFDLILANINRNVLLQDAEKIVNRLHAGGTLVLSGFYLNDLDRIKRVYQQFKVVFRDISENNQWVCAKFAKR